MNPTRFGVIFLAFAACCGAQQTVTVPPSTSAGTMTASSVSVGLGLTDTQKEGILVPIQNSSSAVLQILGVQTTGDLFVEDQPKSVPAKGSANLTILYYGTGGTSGGMDTVRVLTSSGVIVIPMNHGRPQVVTLSANSLSWAIGESGVKSVTVTISGAASMPKAARALGVGNTASIAFLQNGLYRIDVQPGNTTQANRFPVIVDLDPVLPDVTIAINCSVGLSQG